jgi:hypothetical protein
MCAGTLSQTPHVAACTQLQYQFLNRSLLQALYMLMFCSHMQNGMNVARLNMTHGNHEWHNMVVARIRQLNKEKG